jgi:hypothetical protein
MDPAYWIIVLLIGGVSYPGEAHYMFEPDCESAAKVLGSVNYSCLPIYEGKSDDPDFKCGDGQDHKAHCPAQKMGGI